jgi:hypothetical protein
MTSISNGESGSSVRTKLNNSLTVTDAFTISSGKVGIGGTPTGKLDVVGSSGTVSIGTGGDAISFTRNLGNYISASGGGNSYLVFETGGSNERLRIDQVGNVGIGAVANAAAILHVQSTTKGVRFPNMTTTQKNAIANVAGNVVFDTTLGKLCVNSGSGWQTITSV